MNDELIHTIYASRTTEKVTEEDLLDILDAARRNNSSMDLTGMLLHCEGSFFQVLEGTEENVHAIYEKICRDDRHDAITKIIEEAIPERSFGEWTMGFKSMSVSELDQLDGSNDFFQSGACLLNVDKGRAKKLLDAFADGRWRAS